MAPSPAHWAASHTLARSHARSFLTTHQPQQPPPATAHAGPATGDAVASCHSKQQQPGGHRECRSSDGRRERPGAQGAEGSAMGAERLHASHPQMDTKNSNAASSSQRGCIPAIEDPAQNGQADDPRQQAEKPSSGQGRLDGQARPGHASSALSPSSADGGSPRHGHESRTPPQAAAQPSDGGHSPKRMYPCPADAGCEATGSGMGPQALFWPSTGAPARRISHAHDTSPMQRAGSPLRLEMDVPSQASSATKHSGQTSRLTSRVAPGDGSRAIYCREEPDAPQKGPSRASLARAQHHGDRPGASQKDTVQPGDPSKTSPRRPASVFLCPSPTRKKRVTWDWAGGGPPLTPPPPAPHQPTGAQQPTSTPFPPTEAGKSSWVGGLGARRLSLDGPIASSSDYMTSSADRCNELSTPRPAWGIHAGSHHEPVPHQHCPGRTMEQAGWRQSAPKLAGQSKRRLPPEDACSLGPDCWCQHAPHAGSSRWVSAWSDGRCGSSGPCILARAADLTQMLQHVDCITLLNQQGLCMCKP